MMLSGLVRRLRVEEVVFSGDALEPGQRQQVVRISAELGVPVRELVFEIGAPLVDITGSSVA